MAEDTGSKLSGISSAHRPSYTAFTNPIRNTLDSDAGRILCVADVRGNITLLNQIAEETNAKYIIHCGDFGFYVQHPHPAQHPLSSKFGITG
ncbi:uncharacterized protein VTP21DRAFT_8091 [Calcarisporiella thermophila]|uniref:uncharacterized protein n=1 Tax=Calcarisporiella thermophila TaxID=911321 RepID=UPI0037435315